MTTELASTADAPLWAAYDAILADLDGTLIRGPEAIPGAADALSATGVPIMYVTNNASKAPHVAAQHLQKLGFSASADTVMTSAQAAVDMVADHVRPGGSVLVVGHPSFAELARQAGFNTVLSADDQPEAVLQGLSRELTWADLAEGCLALHRQIPWIASNTDTTLPTERGLMPGNGSLVACLEAATGRRPLVAGKPAAGVLRSAAARVNCENPLVVGDRLDTDIQGAVAANMPVLMVLTGVSSVADLVGAPVTQRPTHLAHDLTALHKPSAASRIDTVIHIEVQVVERTLVIDSAEGQGLDLARSVVAELWKHDCDSVSSTNSSIRDRLRDAGLPVH